MYFYKLEVYGPTLRKIFPSPGKFAKLSLISENHETDFEAFEIAEELLFELIPYPEHDNITCDFNPTFFPENISTEYIVEEEYDDDEEITFGEIGEDGVDVDTQEFVDYMASNNNFELHPDDFIQSFYTLHDEKLDVPKIFLEIRLDTNLVDKFESLINTTVH